VSAGVVPVRRWRRDGATAAARLSSRTMPGNPLTDPNWADEMADTVVRTVDAVREKTTVPVIYAARGVVFGILAAFLGLVALVLFLIMAMRGIQALLDLWVSQERAVYLSYFIVGGLISIGGLILFRKRHAAA
jgi:hypothetical protein